MRGWTWFPVFLLIAGCVVNPVTRRPEFVVMSARQEREIGAREAANVEKAMGLVDDSDLVAYVRRIGDRLAVHSPWQDVVYTFHVVDMAEPNAFALPGGFVYVTRGLLALVNSEDELACIIGHEIGHIAARHAVQRISRAVTLAPVAIVTGIAGAVTSIVSPMLGDALGSSGALAVEAALAPYSRRQENQADEVGHGWPANQWLVHAPYSASSSAKWRYTVERCTPARSAIDCHVSPVRTTYRSTRLG